MGGDGFPRKPRDQEISMKLHRILALSALLAMFGSSTLIAETRFDIQLVKSRAEETNVIWLYPKKAKVPGMLWGTNEEYTPGMHAVVLSCGMNSEVEYDDDRVEPADLYRVEHYMLNEEEDWELKGWFRLEQMSNKSLCDKMMQLARLATPARPLNVSLTIADQGLGVRNKVEKWELAP